MSYLEISITLSICLLFIAFLSGVSIAKVRQNKLSRSFLILLGFFLGIETVRLLSEFVFNFRINGIYPFYVIIEFLLLHYFLQISIGNSKKLKIIFGVFASSFVLVTFILYHFYDPRVINYSKVISHISITIITIIILLKNLKEVEVNNLFLPIYGALLLHYATSIFLFLLMKQIIEINIDVWSINNLLTCILYASSIYTFYQLKKL